MENKKTFIDNVIIQGQSTTGISEYEKNEVQIYPNPTSNHVNITSSQRIENLKIYSLQGQIVFDQAIHKNQYSYSVDQLKAGIYFVVSELENKSSICKKLFVD